MCVWEADKILKPESLIGYQNNNLGNFCLNFFHRRMFPSIQINVSGLQRRDNYCIAMEITAASKHRHKYCGYDNENKSAANMGGWSVAGPAEPQHPFERRIYVHPDSPATGEHWLNSAISFNKLKLTNNINDRHTNVSTVTKLL